MGISVMGSKKCTKSSRKTKEKTIGDDQTVDLDDSFLGAGDSCLENAGVLKVGKHVLIEDQPCKIIQIKKGAKVWKGGRSGCFQAQIEARSIFTDKRYELLCPESQKVAMPYVCRDKYT